MKWKWDIRPAPACSYLTYGDVILLEVTPECLPPPRVQSMIAAAPDMFVALLEAEKALKAANNGNCLSSVLDAIALAKGNK